ncbi:subtilisin-like protease SBT3 [Ziziphus jujuba]|uniref:Subtilisin-like protease SBT3 n=1 Tax=Ziziphus jujuba TaxID=326968 RepID=A0A6P4A9R9_ZIZJJ|nr:subtilisin-like protease SBT3 [Ziziphus jujuba]
MGKFNPFKFFPYFLLIILPVSMSSTISGSYNTYIIHMDKSAMPAAFSSHHHWYTATLSSLSSSNGLLPTHLYTYNHVIYGFSAVLSPEHLHQLSRIPGHIATYPEMFGHLHTTHTPQFLGLNNHSGLWPISGFGDDVIIGILDTGIWPESESFDDEGMPPLPERWRGGCESGMEFNSSNCNRKLIGARSFSKGIKRRGLNISRTNDYDSPRDFMGHGTHTSSTAAGRHVDNVEYFGYAKGTATGIAPMARLAMYKVVFDGDTYETAASDVLAGMDQAIADGVDIMSLSLGFPETPFSENPIAVGAFSAMEKGIFVSCSVGNSGPHAYTIFNGAPWITTVGAGTVDRDFVARVTFGDGELTVIGKSIYPENLFVSNVPIYYGYGNRSKEICDYKSLNPKEVAGKYIFCDLDDNLTVFQQLLELDRTEAAGAIFNSDSGQFLKTSDFNLPFVTVKPNDGELVKKYITSVSENNATASIKFQITVIGTRPAPQVAYFSSRGPDRQSPWILKPDILAPGVNILAAWVPNRGLQPIRDSDLLLTDYALVSGTSMASPHAVAIAALLKATHRDWSPAAIRSAMMTSADVVDNTGNPIIDMTSKVAGTPLDFGAGHVNPNKAMDPGLVYDIEAKDYINYLCSLNYTTQQIRVIWRTTSNFTCEYANRDLNYPSFMVILNETNTTTYTFKRVLTNVGDSPSVYRAAVKVPSGMKVSVQPEMISFEKKYSRAEFNLTAEINLGGIEIVPQSDYIGNYGFLLWSEENGKHVVRSPIVSAFAA